MQSIPSSPVVLEFDGGVLTIPAGPYVFGNRDAYIDCLAAATTKLYTADLPTFREIFM